MINFFPRKRTRLYYNDVSNSWLLKKNFHQHQQPTELVEDEEPPASSLSFPSSDISASSSTDLAMDLAVGDDDDDQDYDSGKQGHFRKSLLMSSCAHFTSSYLLI